MKKNLLCILCAFSLSLSVFSQKGKLKRYIPAEINLNSSLTGNSFSYECQVLQIITSSGQKRVLIVLVQKNVKDYNNRMQLRTNYLLKRERIYLERIFFGNVIILEHLKSVDVNTLLNRLEEKYDHPQLWSILNTETFFSTALLH